MKYGVEIDVVGLSRELGIPCIPASAVTSDGMVKLRAEIDRKVRVELGLVKDPKAAKEAKDAALLTGESERDAKISPLERDQLNYYWDHFPEKKADFILRRIESAPTNKEQS